MGQTSVSIRIDEDVKTEVEALFSKLGLSLSAATNVFYRQTLKAQGIPFPITSIDFDPLRQKREAILAKGRKALRDAQEQAIINGTSDMTLDDINEIIKEVRQERLGA
jgi:addiction module RelB/DinJ family antitoxin